VETSYQLLTMFHHTKTAGDLGVLKAQLDLYQKGYIVSVPLTEHAPFDLVITKKGVSQTVQVKAPSLSKDGALEVRFRSSWTDRNGSRYVEVDKTSVGIYCLYCLGNDTCYYLRPTDFGKSVSLRVKMPKNNQSKHVNLADSYREVP